MPKLKIAQELLDILYPIGCVYISTNSTNPSNLFGGQWTQIDGRFLYCTNTSKTTGGSNLTKSHVLTIDEIPSHDHEYFDRMMIWDADGYNTNVQTKNEWDNASVRFKEWGTKTMTTGGGKGHTHEQNLPPWFSVYCWYRAS